MHIAGDIDEDDLSTEADSMLLVDLKEANAAYAELDATPSTSIAELDPAAEKPMAELPAESAEKKEKPLPAVPVELEGNNTPVSRAELAG